MSGDGRAVWLLAMAARFNFGPRRPQDRAWAVLFLTCLAICISVGAHAAMNRWAGVFAVSLRRLLGASHLAGAPCSAQLAGFWPRGIEGRRSKIQAPEGCRLRHPPLHHWAACRGSAGTTLLEVLLRLLFPDQASGRGARVSPHRRSALHSDASLHAARCASPSARCPSLTSCPTAGPLLCRSPAPA